MGSMSVTHTWSSGILIVIVVGTWASCFGTLTVYLKRTAEETLALHVYKTG
jgi:hypothetical protein